MKPTQALPRFCKKQGDIYHARLTIPERLRPRFEGKTAFCQSLDTSNYYKAEKAAYELVQKWKKVIEAAAKETGTMSFSRFWSEQIKATPEAERYIVIDKMQDVAEQKVNSGELSLCEVQTAMKVATGKSLALLPHVEPFLAARKSKGTAEGYKKSAFWIAEHFQTAEAITLPAVKKFLKAYAMTEGGVTKQAIKNLKTVGSQLWKYLEANELVSDDSLNAFLTAKIPMEGFGFRYKEEDHWDRWEEDEIEKQLEMLKTFNPVTAKGAPRMDEKQRKEIALMIMMGCFTGGRREEVMCIKKDTIDLNKRKLLLPGTKNEQSYREIPIHPQMVEIIREGMELSGDEWLFEERTARGRKSDEGNRRGDLHKLWNELREYAGVMHSQKVYHSFRKNLIYKLGLARTETFVIKGIVGHIDTDMTTGLYMGGAPMELMQEAMDKVNYPLLAKYTSLTQW